MSDDMSDGLIAQTTPPELMVGGQCVGQSSRPLNCRSIMASVDNASESMKYSLLVSNELLYLF